MKEIEFRAAMVLECLAEPIRFQIIRQLQRGPKAVCQLAHATKRHQTTICQHLRVLRDLHLVRYRNHGPYAIYELKLKHSPAILDLARNCAQVIVGMASSASQQKSSPSRHSGDRAPPSKAGANPSP